MIIGRIAKVDGIKAVGIFFDRLPPHLLFQGEISPAPQINTFVKTRVGLDIVVCQIVGEHEFEYDKEKQQKSQATEATGPFLVDLEVRGRIVGEEFKGGLRCLPIVGAKLETLTNQDHRSLFSVKGQAIRIGNNLFDSNNSIYLDVNKLMPSHIGIFGNTGSGKSNTITKLLKEYLEIIPPDSNNVKILIFDLNNEYGGNAITSIDSKQVYPLTTRKKTEAITEAEKIPLDFQLLSEDNWGTILRATQKTQMPVIRRASKRWINGLTEEDCVRQISHMLVNKRSQMFLTLREYGGEFFTGIDDIAYNKTTEGFYYQSESGSVYINTSNDVREIKLVNIPDVFDRFLLCLLFEIAASSESGTNFDYIQPLLPRARAAFIDLKKTFVDSTGIEITEIFLDKPLAVIQLGNVSVSTRETIPSLISDLLFQHCVTARKDDRPKAIYSIVVDEAHNILASDTTEHNDLIHDNTLRVFERVIKEGRKFGVFLYIASQRPSDISSTITSQIHNYFIHKLVNPNDIERIRKTVSFMGDSSLSLLSALGQGECIVSGPSLYMPQYVYVDELDNESKPNSSDIVLFGDNGLFNNFSDSVERVSI